MQLAMWMGTALQARRMMWVSVCLTAIYALVMAFVFYPPGDFAVSEWLLFTEGLFAGPMLIAGLLSILMRRLETRRVMVFFQAGYIFITLAIYHATFTGEHDAQYQLALFFIPLIGFPGVAIAGLITAFHR